MGRSGARSSRTSRAGGTPQKYSEIRSEMPQRPAIQPSRSQRRAEVTTRQRRAEERAFAAHPADEIDVFHDREVGEAAGAPRTASRRTNNAWSPYGSPNSATRSAHAELDDAREHGRRIEREAEAAQRRRSARGPPRQSRRASRPAADCPREETAASRRAPRPRRHSSAARVRAAPRARRCPAARCAAARALGSSGVATTMSSAPDQSVGRERSRERFACRDTQG